MDTHMASFSACVRVLSCVSTCVLVFDVCGVRVAQAEAQTCVNCRVIIYFMEREDEMT